MSLGGGALLLAPAVVALAAASRLDAAPLVSPAGIVVLAWLGLVTTAAAYLLYATGLRMVEASTVGSLALGEPLTATLLGLAVLGERPDATTLAGAALLLGGDSPPRSASECAANSRCLGSRLRVALSSPGGGRGVVRVWPKMMRRSIGLTVSPGICR